MLLNKNIEMNNKYIKMVFWDMMGVLRKYPHFTWYVSPDEMNCRGKKLIDTFGRPIRILVNWARIDQLVDQSTWTLQP